MAQKELDYSNVEEVSEALSIIIATATTLRKMLWYHSGNGNCSELEYQRAIVDYKILNGLPYTPMVKPENNKHMAELHEWLNEQNQNIDL